MTTSPRRLGKYELRQRLGQGGMAEVWKALDTQLQRYVAIKLLHANLQADPNFITRFQREAQLIASLHHSNIVNIHDFQVSYASVGMGESEEKTFIVDSSAPIAYMVMDYIEGPTLADYIRNTSARGQLPSTADIIHLFTALSSAIDYAHQKGMIHRDIKPANILLDQRNTIRSAMGEPVLTDFGVAKLLGVSASALSGAAVGTPLYISPEQAQGLPGNERSDLYSLGVILYEVLTGVTPFQGDMPAAVLTQHITTAPTSPALINPSISPAVAAVAMRSIAKDPNARFPSATAMAEALSQAFSMASFARAGATATPTLLQMDERMNPRSTVVDGPLYRVPPLQEAQASTPQPAIPGVTPVVQSSQPYPATVLSGNVGRTTPASGTTRGTVPTPAAPNPPVQLPPMPPAGQGRRRLYSVLIVLAILVLIGAGLGGYFLYIHQPSATPAGPVFGHAFFISSGQLNPGSAQGIADQVEIDLHNIPAAQPGKSYYAWLLGDIHPSPEAQPLQPAFQVPIPLLLAKLDVSQGNVHFFYKGDAQHDNLFSVTSRFLITEEDANVTPTHPSTDRSTWRYYAEIPQTPYGQVHLSALDHIRHLFYKETRVAVLGLPGGLDIWLFRDTEKLLEWSVSARDAWQTNPTDRSQFIRILDYIDGLPNVHLDLPAGTPVLADPLAAKVGLLEVDPANQGANPNLEQNPPGYVVHVALHLNGVIGAPDATPQMRQLATQIIQALNNATVWLGQVRKDARQLFSMTDAQLAQPSTLALLDDLVTQATYAYIGRLNPATNQVQPAVLQVHYDVQQLATFTVMNSLPNSI